MALSFRYKITLVFGSIALAMLLVIIFGIGQEPLAEKQVAHDKDRLAEKSSNGDIIIKQNHTIKASPSASSQIKADFIKLLNKNALLNLTEQEIEQVANILEKYWNQKIIIESELAHEGKPENGKPVFIIPIYPENGLALQDEIKSEIFNLLGEDKFKAVSEHAYADIAWNFDFFGNCQQQITFSNYINGRYYVEWEVGAMRGFEPIITPDSQFLHKMSSHVASRNDLLQNERLKVVSKFADAIPDPEKLPNSPR